jgi:transposase-like protein
VAYSGEEQESQLMSKRRSEKVRQVDFVKRRRFTDELKAEAGQMLLDGHAAGSLSERLGLSSPNVL